jgi:hypothetical protein
VLAQLLLLLGQVSPDARRVLQAGNRPVDANLLMPAMLLLCVVVLLLGVAVLLPAAGGRGGGGHAVQLEGALERGPDAATEVPASPRALYQRC